MRWPIKYKLAALTNQQVRMAERSKALRSGRSLVLQAWVRIPLLTILFPFFDCFFFFFFAFVRVVTVAMSVIFLSVSELVANRSSSDVRDGTFFVPMMRNRPQRSHPMRSAKVVA